MGAGYRTKVRDYRRIPHPSLQLLQDFCAILTIVSLYTAEFAKLIEHWDAESADISIMDPMEWDSQGQYTQVIEAVREATKGNDVRVYRVVRDETRCEYWVVSREQGRMVGVKALGVES